MSRFSQVNVVADMRNDEKSAKEMVFSVRLPEAAFITKFTMYDLTELLPFVLNLTILIFIQGLLEISHLLEKSKEKKLPKNNIRKLLKV